MMICLMDIANLDGQDGKGSISFRWCKDKGKFHKLYREVMCIGKFHGIRSDCFSMNYKFRSVSFSRAVRNY